MQVAAPQESSKDSKDSKPKFITYAFRRDMIINWTEKLSSSGLVEPSPDHAVTESGKNREGAVAVYPLEVLLADVNENIVGMPCRKSYSHRRDGRATGDDMSMVVM